jgi:hypothetical protein
VESLLAEPLTKPRLGSQAGRLEKVARKVSEVELLVPGAAVAHVILGEGPPVAPGVRGIQQSRGLEPTRDEDAGGEARRVARPLPRSSAPPDTSCNQSSGQSAGMRGVDWEGSYVVCWRGSVW